MIEQAAAGVGSPINLFPPFKGEPVSLEAEHCLNARHKKAGCQQCADVCPTGAISLASRTRSGPLQPHLNADQCVRCGLCLHACPTDVFSQPAPAETKLVQTVANLPAGPVSLVCPYHPDPGLTNAPVTTVGRHQRCLAALSTSWLLELSHNGQRGIWLDDTPCASCPIGRVQPVISQVATATNTLLQVFGHVPAIFTQSDPANRLSEPAKRLARVEGDQPKLSRRGLLGVFGRAAHQTVAEVARPEPPPARPARSIPASQRLPHRLPRSRERLLAQLANLGQPITERINTTGLPFTGITLEETGCSACQLCARFCPTGALRYLADETGFGLLFRPALCLDCGICAVTCPEDAVRFEVHMAAEALVADKWQPLLIGGLTACAGCGESTAVRSGETGPVRCSLCRRQSPLARS